VNSEKLALEFIKDKIRTLNSAIKNNDVIINYVHRVVCTHRAGQLDS
jgi:hypothetical protein